MSTVSVVIPTFNREGFIEQCVVSGTMQGRAKVNLKVEGEVVAKMTCEFNN